MDIIEIVKIITPWFSGSVAGVLLTLIVNSKLKRKNRKVLNIEADFHKYSLDFCPSNKLNVDKDIKVTYNSEEYSNLLFYSVILTNSGNKLIDRSKIILRFPESADVIESEINSSPIVIEKKFRIKKSMPFIEYHLQLEKIEVNDEISLSFLGIVNYI